uniref:hypothetical protein n=1 Tax=Candidatus Electrothrix sp. TaxID=2170559 RepID=UPI004057C2AB
MNREKRTLREFLLEYATTFFRQYLAYCEQDAMLFSNDSMSLNKLASLSTTHTASQMALEYIEQFLERYTSHDEEDALIHWDAFIRVPERLGSHSGIRVAVIIDEFQDMQTSVYNMPKELMDSKDRSEGYGAILLANTFDRQAQSRKAPMLVSGSAVTMVFRTVMGGPLGGRFDLMYMKPLSIPDGAALLHTTLKYYGQGQTISIRSTILPAIIISLWTPRPLQISSESRKRPWQQRLKNSMPPTWFTEQRKSFTPLMTSA